MDKAAKNNFSALVSPWLPVAVWASVIYFFSSLLQQQTSQVLIVDFVIKKIAHLSEYAILYTLVYRATRKKLLLSLILTIIYAATDELHQSFVPGRTAKLYDVIGFDLAGASIAAFLLWKLKQHRPGKL